MQGGKYKRNREREIERVREFTGHCCDSTLLSISSFDSSSDSLQGESFTKYDVTYCKETDQDSKTSSDKRGEE